MIRSAKMKASTPPKLMPPFQSTAASGTLPIEQTKLMIATDRADQRPPELRQRRWSLEEEALPERVGHPGGERAGDQQAAEDVAPDRGPVHHEVVRGRREAGRRAQALPPAPLAAGRTCPSRRGPPSSRAAPCRPAARASSTSCCFRKSRNSDRDQDDHQRPADELAEHELPAQEQRHDDPELDHQVGRGDLEHHRRGEVRALAKQRARERDRRVGAATRTPRRGRSRPAASAASRRAAAGASPPSRRPPARPPRARTRGSAPTGSPTSSRTRTRARPGSPGRCRREKHQEGWAPSGSVEARLRRRRRISRLPREPRRRRRRSRSRSCPCSSRRRPCAPGAPGCSRPSRPAPVRPCPRSRRARHCPCRSAPCGRGRASTTGLVAST